MAPSAISPTGERFSTGQGDVTRPSQNGHAAHAEDELLDILCVGFGPASLATAIALSDAYTGTYY
jgi:hypothetical protein